MAERHGPLRFHTVSLALEDLHYVLLRCDQRARKYVEDEVHNGVMAREGFRESLPMQILTNYTLTA